MLKPVDNARDDEQQRAAAGIGGGMSMGIGSLPFQSFREAFGPALDGTDIATIPTLPRRSPAENGIAQALVGIRGITLGQYGSLAVDVSRLDADAYVATDLSDPAFASFRHFIKHAADYEGPLKWQFVGPVTLGAVLHRAGAPTELAYQVAQVAVRDHCDYLLREIARGIPNASQIVILNEPRFSDCELPLDQAVDLLSGALAALEADAVVGVRCGPDPDIAAILDAGPQILALRSSLGIIERAGYLQRFLGRGGMIAWGAVTTDGPLPSTSERAWRRLSELWRQLVERGCDPLELARQSLITPESGLSGHTAEGAIRILRLTAEIASRVKQQAGGSMLSPLDR